MTKKSDARIKRDANSMLEQINKLPDKVSESFNYEGYIDALKFWDSRKAFGICRAFLRRSMAPQQ